MPVLPLQGDVLGFRVGPLPCCTCCSRWFSSCTASNHGLQALLPPCREDCCGGTPDANGQNATTWMLPGEIFPTEVRATCHGISAATGKAGALVAGIWFAYLTPAGRFYVSAFFNLAGLLLTALFVRARPCTLRPGLAFQPGANVFAASRCWMHARCVDNAVLQMR